MTESLILDSSKNGRSYFGTIPHMAGATLDVYEHRLYCHYIEVCGLSPWDKCTQAERTIYKACKMSKQRFLKARDGLVAKGFVTFRPGTPNKKGQKGYSALTTIPDIWEENIQFCKARPYTGQILPVEGVNNDPLKGSDITRNKKYKNLEKEKDSVVTKSSDDAVAADECIIHADCLHYDNGCKLESTGFKLLGDCNGCNGYHKMAADNGDPIQGIALGSDGRLTAASWKRLDATTDNAWLEEHAVEDQWQRMTWKPAMGELICMDCKGIIRRLPGAIEAEFYTKCLPVIEPLCPGCWNELHNLSGADLIDHDSKLTGDEIQHMADLAAELGVDDTPPKLTAEEAAVLKQMSLGTLFEINKFCLENRDTLVILQTKGYMHLFPCDELWKGVGDEMDIPPNITNITGDNRYDEWAMTYAGRAALEAWQLLQKEQQVESCDSQPIEPAVPQLPIGDDADSDDIDESIPPPEQVKPKAKKLRKKKADADKELKQELKAACLIALGQRKEDITNYGKWGNAIKKLVKVGAKPGDMVGLYRFTAQESVKGGWAFNDPMAMATRWAAYQAQLRAQPPQQPQEESKPLSPTKGIIRGRI